ncbi:MULTISPECIES: hypothetical protein [unclassified Bacillus cereus group]|uniref:hypothetical protein n=1 Tax=unclassified Bacillus cereus group TaxID=2750818 RepID=UPI001F574F48|nr:MULTISPECIES: hypothetical protein [unclassified Bacillus cereus group]
MKNFRIKITKACQSFWGCFIYGILIFIIFLMINLTDTPLHALTWRDWLGSIVGAGILSAGMFTISKLNLK